MTTNLQFGKTIKAIACMASLIVITNLVQAQAICFVSASASNDNGDGQTWETAKKTIAAGITAVGTNGTVFVKAGNYNTTAEFTVTANVTVKGGYILSSTGNDTNQRRMPGVNSHWTDNTYCSIVAGAGSHRVATVNGTLDGFVVRNGYSTTQGGGLMINGGTVRYCVIKECYAIGIGGTVAEGGGAYIHNGGTLINNVITECRADNGSAVAGENGTLVNNTITRNRAQYCGTVTDYDDNVYHAVQIGEQCWMKENLRTTHYADGSVIQTSTTTSSTVPYYYQNPNLDVTQYGLLYNWAAVMNGAASSNVNPSGVQGICPNGWHVPSNAEWTQLIDYVKSQPEFVCGTDANAIAKALSSQTGWSGYSSTCVVGYQPSQNNATQFSAMPSGEYYSGGYSGLGTHALFYTATQGYVKIVTYNYSYVYNGNFYNYNASSVRCLRD